MKKPELVVIDSCTILWVVNWPTNGLVSDNIANCNFKFLKLQSRDIAVVLNRYHDFRVKSSIRADTRKFSARTHFLIPSSPLQGKSVTLTSASSKRQIIRYIIGGVIQRAVSGCYSNTLLITGLLVTPTEITRGIAIERQYLKTSHEETDIIMVQHAYQKVLDHQVDIVSAICDDAGVLVLLTYFYWKSGLSSTVYICKVPVLSGIFLM